MSWVISNHSAYYDYIQAGILGRREHTHLPAVRTRAATGAAPASAAEHGRATIKALAALKQQLFARELAICGVLAFPGTLALPHRLREQGLPVAVVTSSRNSGAVLAAAHLAGLFDVTVDGADALRMRLAGEPDLATEGMREALCTLGERTVENMHLVNTPDWLSLGAGGRRGLVRRQPQPAGHLPAGTGPAARRADPRHPLSRRKEARTRVLSDKLPLEASRNLHTSDAGWVAHEFELQLAPGIRFG